MQDTDRPTDQQPKNYPDYAGGRRRCVHKNPPLGLQGCRLHGADALGLDTQMAGIPLGNIWMPIEHIVLGEAAGVEARKSLAKTGLHDDDVDAHNTKTRRPIDDLARLIAHRLGGIGHVLRMDAAAFSKDVNSIATL
eukprot:6328585-Amphidinium_carterae.1